MNRKTQDLAWSVLPKEFKEEVKRLYHTPGLRAEVYTLLQNLFGAGNLTSDAEGEEMLTCEKSRVQQQYKRATQLKDDSDPKWELVGDQMERVLIGLFGSKCLPDELTEDNFGKSEPKPAEPNPDGDNLSPEPKAAPTFADAAPTFADDCKSRPNRTPSSYTQPVTDCHQIDRLHIAAMAMQGLLSNADRMKMYEDIASSPLSDNLTRIVARNALRYADALIAEAQKGGSHEKV